VFGTDSGGDSEMNKTGICEGRRRDVPQVEIEETRREFVNEFVIESAREQVENDPNDSNDSLPFA
jgi:hypothetical protein